MVQGVRFAPALFRFFNLPSAVAHFAQAANFSITQPGTRLELECGTEFRQPVKVYVNFVLYEHFPPPQPTPDPEDPETIPPPLRAISS